MLKRTPLFDVHKEYGAKIIEFFGWEMPVQYEGLVEEHNAVRNAAGIFDVSHMGEVEVTGEEALDYVNNLVTNNVADLVDGQVLYAFMCYEKGTVVDDLLVYRFNQNHFYLVINASNIDKDFKWMQEQVGDYRVKIENTSDNVAEVAVQGPEAQNILQTLTDTDLNEIKFFHCRRDIKVAGVNCLVSRTGYTGEDGFEVYTAPADVATVWNAFLEAGKEKGAMPAGLGCRDTLRFEACLPLYGQELSDEITPLEAGLKMFVKLDKENFIGKEALVKQSEEGLKRRIVGFEISKGIARHGYDVVNGGEKIGFVTTGYKSPTLGTSIGLAMVDIEYAKLGTEIEIQVRKKTQKAVTISKRFLKKNYKK